MGVQEVQIDFKRLTDSSMFCVVCRGAERQPIGKSPFNFWCMYCGERYIVRDMVQDDD